MTMSIFGVGSLDPSDQSELIRKHLQNLTTSYADESDVFTELIQNAIDAVNSAPMLGKTPRRITVVIGRRKDNAHYVYVQDNGVGMPADVVNKVFIPGFSSGKKPGTSIGYKGVGMSYVVAVSEQLAVATVTAAGRIERTVLHAHDWVSDSEKPEPIVTNEFTAPPLVIKLADSLERGTGVYFSFHAGSDPKSLDNIVIITEGVEKELRGWASFLAARTAIGLTAKELGDSPPIEVRLIVDRGDDQPAELTLSRSEWSPEDNTIGYPFPHSVFKVGTDTSNIDSTSEAQRSIRHGRKHQAIYHTWTAGDLVGAIDNLDDDEEALLLNSLRWVYGYLAYSTDVLKTVRQEMSTRYQVVRYGARLAVDGVPQGRALELALTSDQGLERQTHIVLAFDEIQLDTGRKFISNERILQAINKLTQRVVTRLKDYRWALKIKDRAPVESDIKSWVASINARAGNSVLSKAFEHLGATPPSTVDPDNEQELIAVWTALITTGILPGYSMKAISGYERYDAIVDIGADAVGGQEWLLPISTDFTGKLNAVLEFKVSFDSLIEDFDKKTKIASEIDLVVCWDCPDLSLRVGALEPTYGRWSHSRVIRGASYVWTDDSGATQFQVIAMRNLIAELLVLQNDPAGVPALQTLENRDAAKLV
jgi:hypothetical protein